MKNKLIDAYVARLGESLPEKDRADIEAEISSLLQDMVESRAEAENREPDDEMVITVLREYGEPEKVAASYREPRYLIGPRLFPAFLTVLKIILAVLGAVALAGLVYTLTRLGSVPLETIIKQSIEAIAKYLGTAVSVFGNVVLIFAILEIALPRIGRKKKEWDPRSLTGFTPVDSIEPAGLAADIAFCAFAIVLFNFYPDWIGITFKQGAGWVKTGTILTPFFFSLLPWLTIAWVAKIAVDVALLAKGRWTRALRWGFAAVQVFMIGVLATMLFGAPIIDLSSISAIPGMTELQELPFGGGIYFTVRFILLIIIGSIAWDTFKVIKPEFRRQPVPSVE
jgi:hypothetical protein